MLKKLTPQDKALDLADDLESGELDNVYDQSFWAYPCKTPACIAGHLVYKYGDFEAAFRFEYFDEGDGNPNDSFFSQAKEILGLGFGAGISLFSGAPFYQELHASRQPTAKEAAAMLRHWAATGEIKWKRLD